MDEGLCIVMNHVISRYNLLCGTLFIRQQLTMRGNAMGRSEIYETRSLHFRITATRLDNLNGTVRHTVKKISKYIAFMSTDGLQQTHKKKIRVRATNTRRKNHLYFNIMLLFMCVWNFEKPHLSNHTTTQKYLYVFDIRRYRLCHFNNSIMFEITRKWFFWRS